MGLKDQAVTWRRYFHQFPELSDKEFKTTQKIKDILTEHHIRILDLPLATGLVAEV
ncbi:TPA: amidohydrolase, partial [Staphylococcus aureus]|nr:amidohydrolase [Staphylococcus aureus]HDB1248727.1 amidohydrolase [Staphylococcus aureus]HDM5993370.1 amidohydrolase [Staphylococcus aureus]